MNTSEQGRQIRKTKQGFMNARRWLGVLMTCALSLGTALAGARLDEMKAMIESGLEVGEERDALLEAAKEYIDERDAALTTLKSLTESTNADALAGDWNDTVQDMLDIPVLVDVDDELTSEAALDIYNTLVDEERSWVYALSQINSVTYRDKIVSLKIRLSTMTEQLETQWQKLLNDDGQLDQKELEVMADINEIAVA